MCGLDVCAQRIFVNTIDALYELTGGVGSCTYVNAGNFCQGHHGQIFSTALYKDTLYYISLDENALYSVKLDAPGSCTFLTTFPVSGTFSASMNALTVDKNGILYAIDFFNDDFYRYNPYTDQLDSLGKVPHHSAGDLLFYKDKLLLSTIGYGIWEINIDTPANSVQYMSTGNFEFFGLISFPYECGKNKVYAFAPAGGFTRLVELDLEARMVVGVVCSLPFVVYDGASVVENGNTIGISVDSILLHSPCSGTGQTGSARIVARSASPGSLTYLLDNTISNTDGIFANVSPGTHQLKITNQLGCTKDTSFEMVSAHPDYVGDITTAPTICDGRTGSISIQIIGSTAGVTAALNNGTPSSQFSFNDLAAGQYRVSIFKTGGCPYDTTVNVLKQAGPRPSISITATNQVCFDNNGKVVLNVTGQGAPFSFNFNNSGFSSNTTYDKLPPGGYPIIIRNAQLCTWDTVVQVMRYNPQAINVNVKAIDPTCKDVNSGSITIEVTGSEAPYLLQWNNQLFSNGTTFTSGPGSFIIPILNKDHCAIDSAKVLLELIATPECDDVFVPNAFTPNRDPYNSTFKPIHSRYVKNLQIKIYNRWGQLVFSNQGSRQEWDGTINGTPASAGTYVWTLTYDNAQGIKKFKKGVLLLIR